MAIKTEYTDVLDTVVNSGVMDFKESSVVPNGKEAVLLHFSGSCQGSDYVALQWGKTGEWETIFASYGNFNYQDIRKSFIGGNGKKFRIARVNQSTENQRIFVSYSVFLRGSAS